MKKNENILLKMHGKEAKAGITRTNVDHTLGKTCKVFYIIAFICSAVIHLLYLLSVWMDKENTVSNIGIENLTVLQEDQLAQINNSLILVAILSILLIAGLVLLIKRAFIPALVINTVSPVVLALHFAERMSDTLSASGLLCSYTYKHLIPLALLFVSSLVYCIIGIRFNVSENKAYTAFCDALYVAHSDEFDKITDEEWESFLSTYEPPQKPKKTRSEKAAERKAKKKEE